MRSRFVLESGRSVTNLLLVSILVALLTGNAIAQAGPATPQALTGTGFTYQGQLKNASGFVTGVCDFQFSLWDAVSAGTQLGATHSLAGVSVSNGLFTVPLNDANQFGANAFNGLGRWLQVDVKCAGDPAFITLSPRQPLTPAPYALALPGLRATIGGGDGNSATGAYATVPGGQNNSAATYSMAAGRRAKAVNTGSFVWADSINADFSSTVDNQFAIRAATGQFIANDAGGAKVVPVGTRYRDNAIVAWARVTAAGGLDTNFNVASVTRISTGYYSFTLDSSLSSGFSLVPIVTPEIDGPGGVIPVGAANVRFAVTDQVAAGNTFNVYIYNGNFALADNDFQVLVTGR